MDKDKTKSYVLKVHRNIYRQTQAGRVWNKYLVNKLTKEVGFVQSNVDKCVFCKGKMMYTLYTDDSILARPDLKEIDNIIKQMRPAKHDVTGAGALVDCRAVSRSRLPAGSVP